MHRFVKIYRQAQCKKVVKSQKDIHMYRKAQCNRDTVVQRHCDTETLWYRDTVVNILLRHCGCGTTKMWFIDIGVQSHWVTETLCYCTGTRTELIIDREKKTKFLRDRETRTDFLKNRKTRTEFLRERETRTEFLRERETRTGFLREKETRTEFLRDRETRT